MGESGCGKSITALSIARLVPEPPARYLTGQILLGGRDVLRLPESELRKLRGGVVSYVFQEPGASLNPVIRVGHQIKEALKLHRPDRATDAEVVRLLTLVGIAAPESRRKDYPFQMSGGMQQRVMIAMALASEPDLLVADEPTTALDVTTQAQILELLRDLNRRLGMSILLITHNLAMVGEMADRVAVMYAGQIVELSPARELLERPLHPYTRALMASVPKLSAGARWGEATDEPPSPALAGCGAPSPTREDPSPSRLCGTSPREAAPPTRRLQAIPGSVPRPGELPPGCRFAPRCSRMRPECSLSVPELVEIEPGRWVRCPFWQ